MKLIIIGNGFDLHHCLPTRFTDFKEFLDKGNNHLALVDILNLSGEDLWQDFEENIAKVDMDLINKKRSEKRLIGQFWKKNIDQCKESFSKWIQSIDVTNGRVSPVIDSRVMNSENLFLTFNYTKVLEAVYGIHKEQICHIHGITDRPSSIVFGHGITQNRGQYPKEKNEYLRATFKNPQKNIDHNIEFFDRMKSSSIDEIIVMGCSLSDIDMPYFKKIVHTVDGKVNWIITAYSQEEERNFPKKMHSLNVPLSQIGIVKMSDIDRF